MSAIYTNTTSLQNAFHIEFNKPLDDRMSHNSVESFLINKSNPTACPLYKKAYVGMPVSVLNADRTAALLYVCKDATPYIFQGAGKPGAADVTAETIGNYWTLMSGGEYKLVKASTANSGMLATYKMQYKAPGQNTFSDIVGAASIDIPKDYLLKEVHLCKASYRGGVYTETSKPGSSSWNTDNNDVYIHFIWFTKDGGSEKTSETYLRVSDVINVDVTNINSSIAAINRHIDSSYVSLNSSVASHINASVNAINTHIDASIAAVNRHIDSSYVSLNSSVASHIDASVNAIKTQIASSLAALNSSIDASWVAINNHIDSSYVSLNSSVASHIDASVNAINTRIDSSLATLNSAIDSSWVAINTRIDDSYESLNSSVALHIDTSVNAINTHVNSSVNAINAHIEEYDAVHAGAFTDL